MYDLLNEKGRRKSDIVKQSYYGQAWKRCRRQAQHDHVQAERRDPSNLMHPNVQDRYCRNSSTSSNSSRRWVKHNHMHYEFKPAVSHDQDTIVSLSLGEVSVSERHGWNSIEDEAKKVEEAARKRDGGVLEKVMSVSRVVERTGQQEEGAANATTGVHTSVVEQQTREETTRRPRSRRRRATWTGRRWMRRWGGGEMAGVSTSS